MKVYYINILLFALLLNILAHNKNKKSIITRHTKTNRTLCECELYAPVNYDNDPQMKEVMENFNKQTQQRFHEYDERLQSKRKQCKEQCDKEIQKIILKDKLEKELMDKFATLHTDIQSDAIPTCICEKSMVDKMEKGCLRCGVVLGGGVMPGFGTIGGTALYALSQLKPMALDAAMRAAMAKGLVKGVAAGKDAGMKVVILGLKALKADELIPGTYKSFVATKLYTEVTELVDIIDTEIKTYCSVGATSEVKKSICVVRKILKQEATPGETWVPQKTAIKNLLDQAVEKGKLTANTEAADVISRTSSKIISKESAAIDATYTSWQTAITASVIAIVIIVLIMVIIYLILRYRRKKKMKKKLQYIKLLEE
ncbi:rifin [Plasmodium reichenowi]|uniref:Rifin n=1 Tax=Plasmodium reichenowi TaxID=5854 RepID=A0A060RRJ0_PLARE|nr:rifin [Plasmodium reichenowi]